MSKKVKAIIAGSIVLVLLVGVLVALVLTKKDDIAKPSDIQDSYLTIIQEQTNNIEYVKVKNEKDEYTISLQAENRWGIAEISEYEPDYSLFLVTLGQATNVVALDTIEEDSKNLEKFGLGSPKIIFEVKAKDKEAIVINLGATSSDNTAIYFTKNDEKTVYIASANAFPNMAFDRYEYISKVLVPGFDSENLQDIPAINEMTIIRPDLEKPIKIEQFDVNQGRENAAAQADIIMMSPYNNVMLAYKAIENYIYGNFGIVAQEIVTANPTSQQLQEFGFDKPTSVFELKYGGTSSVKITTGKAIYSDEEDESKRKIVSYYAMREGINQVYIVDASSLKWMTVKPEMFIDSIQVLPHILDIKTIDLLLGDKTNTIEFIKGEDKTDASQLTTKVNGKDADAKLVKQYLQVVLSTSIQGIGDQSKAKNLVASIQYNYTNGTKDLLEVYMAEDLTCTIILNKKNVFVSRAGFVDKLEQEFQKLLSGKEIDLDW